MSPLEALGVYRIRVLRALTDQLVCFPYRCKPMTKLKKELTADYTNIAGTYDSHRYEGGAAEFRLSHVLETVTKMIAPNADMKILDVATGTGKAALALANSNAKIVGLDFTEPMLQIAQQKIKTAAYENIQLVRGNAAQLPFASDEFDAVVSLNFLHLFPPVSRQRKFVREMHRVLRPGGVLVIELINLYQGLLLGLIRRRFGVDLGFNAPRDIRRMLGPEFKIRRIVGGTLPGMWRLPYAISKLSPQTAHFVGGLTKYSPWKYVAFNLFVQAIKS